MDDVWRERLVDLVNGDLTFAYGATDWPMPDIQVGDGWFYEVSPQSLSIVGTLAAHVARRQGAGLIVDYGYAFPAGEDTLYAVREHKFPDVLATPGQADVTAEVDFTALCAAAEGQGARVAGPIGQGAFLQAMNIGWRAAFLKRHASEELAACIDKDLHRLVDPAQMGVWFKAMGIAGKGIGDLAGF
jgi:NADH dehydrogenase [ubiquinone] 1 alpha subcomplex assembly factor 7